MTVPLAGITILIVPLAFRLFEQLPPEIDAPDTSITTLEEMELIAVRVSPGTYCDTTVLPLFTVTEIAELLTQFPCCWKPVPTVKVVEHLDIKSLGLLNTYNKFNNKRKEI